MTSCQGGCGRTVTAPEKWCSHCWPSIVEAAKITVNDERSIRFSLLHAAYKLALGTQEEQEEALSTINHLSFVLTNYNNKETQ